MREENRLQRREAIEAAAYELLEENGYLGTSMLAIAKRAKASNETLYRWYGDKQGLFLSLVESNAAQVRGALEAALSGEQPAAATLQRIAELLLSLLVSERAITLNRAAAADPSGQLSASIVKAGRQSIAPLVGKLFERARAEGELRFEDTRAAVDLFLDLLVGDLQIRRLNRAVKPLGRKAIEQRARAALSNLKTLLETAAA